MSNGYILLWRKSLESTVWTDPKLWRLWSWCLLQAAWKERTVLLGRVPVRLSPGELAAPLDDMARGTGLSQKEVRTCLALGKKLGCLAVRGTARGMLVGIVNWQDYQRPGAAQTPPPDWMRGTPSGVRTAGPGAGRGQGSGQAGGAPSLDEKKGNQGSNATTQGAGAGPEALSDPDCERFLDAYPKGTARQAARAAWEAMRHELPPLSELLAAVERQARTPGWTREGGRYIPGPANWLVGRRWRDSGPVRPGVDQWLGEGGGQ